MHSEGRKERVSFWQRGGYTDRSDKTINHQIRQSQDKITIKPYHHDKGESERESERYIVQTGIER